jgi:thiamine biosynthesis lipoprotein
MQYFQQQIALGSFVQICLISNDKSLNINQYFAGLWQRIFRYESRFSRFIPTSELSILNRNAGFKFTASKELVAILSEAKRLSLVSDGIFNPFILPRLQAAGYDHSLVKGYESDYQDNYSFRQQGSIEQLQIGQNWVKIPSETAIDLGGIGKGYLADILAGELSAKTAGFWLSLGGDVSFGGLNENDHPWQINIERSANEGTLAVYTSKTGKSAAIATSSILVRRGKRYGRPWHHLIDPRTQAPAVTSILQASVAASSASVADVFAKCAVIIGSADPAVTYLKKRHIKDALLQLDPAANPKLNPVIIGQAISLDNMD